MLFKDIESYLAEYPIYQYAFIKSKDIEFSDRVRTICKRECKRYGHSWSCPPAVGSVRNCKQICRAYPNALLFSTVADVPDYSDMERLLETKEDHELITRQILKYLQSEDIVCYALSSDSCSVCEKCAYPKPCRHPEIMLPCIESHGIVVMNAIEKCHMDFYLGEQIVLWFTLIFLKNVEE